MWLAELPIIVGAERERATGRRDKYRMLISAGDADHHVVLYPERSGKVVTELAFAERENCP